MSKLYRKVRGIPDKVLAGALQQHAGGLAYVLNRVAAYDRVRWIRRVWYVIVTLAAFSHNETVNYYAGVVLRIAVELGLL